MDFDERKAAAMAALSSASADKSPKGSLDAPIASLVAALNRLPSTFTTSSCSGRITILSHPKIDSTKKAGGGRWLLVSHHPAVPEAVAALLFSPDAAITPGSLVFRFEPLIIALECRCPEAAQWVVSKAIACGFRESGITSLGKRIMVAIRCSIRMEVPLGDGNKLMVTSDYVRYLTGIANEKMEANRRRTEGFYQMLLQEELIQSATSTFNPESGAKCGEVSTGPKSRRRHTPPSATVDGCVIGNASAFSDILHLADAKSVVASSCDCKDGLDKGESPCIRAMEIGITGEPMERLFLWGHSSCVADHMGRACIMIFGGFGGIGQHSRRNDILVLDPQSWLLRAVDAKEPPSPRIGHTSSIIDDQVYVIGGRCGPADVLSDVLVFDMLDLRWKLLGCTGSIFQARHRHAAASIGTSVYIFGGLGNDSIYSSMHVLDTKTLCWSEVDRKGEWPCARHSHSLVAYGSKLFLFGGYDGERVLGDLYSFDVETLTWKEENCSGRPPIPRFSHCSFVYKNYLGIIGGCPLRKESQEIALLDMTNHTWKHANIISGGKDLWIRSSAIIMDDDLVLIGGGASCYAFGTKFSCPSKISLLVMDSENRQFARMSDCQRMCNKEHVRGLVPVKCTGMEKSSRDLEDPSSSCYNTDHDEEQVKSREGDQLLKLRVEKKYAKLGKDILKKFQWLDLGRKVASNDDGGQIYFPVTDVFFKKWEAHKNLSAKHLSEPCQLKDIKVNEVSIPEALALLRACGGFLMDDDKPNVKKASSPPRKVLMDTVSSLLVNSALPLRLLEQLPNRWELLGDMVVLPVTCFSDPLWNSIAGELWPAVAKSLNAARLARQGRVLPTGTRDSTLEVLVGDSGWVTHKENGIIYTFDATKCMFSAGNLSEKLRMSRLDCSNEIVVDLFAGIGYFVLPFLVKSKAKLVYACEWNPCALEALRHNLELNVVSDRCIVLEGDNRITAPVQVADRVCLGLLPSSEDSWVTAIRALKREGGVLHIHGNVNDSDERAWSEHVVRSIDIMAKLEGCYWDVSIEHLERVKWYGPHIRHIVIDVRCRQHC